MHNKEIALLLDDDDLESYYWSGKVMRDNSDYEFEKLMKYNPEGVLWYYTHIERKRIMENKEIIFKILSTIIGFNKNKGKTVFEEQDLIISFFTELDRSSFYSEEYATICLQLSKYNYNHRIFGCIKKYYYYHPEKICRIINEKSDEYFDADEFERYYELPVYAFNNYENIKSFIQFINENVNDDCKPEAHVLIGKLLSRALDEGLTEKNNIIFKIMDNDSNKNIDSGFVLGYDSLNSVRAVEDGSDQKRISDTINNVAEDIDLEFSHSASLLREISKRYLDNSKIDFITSEFGLDVL